MFIDFLTDQFKENSEKEAIIFNDQVYRYQWLSDKLIEAHAHIQKNNIRPGEVVGIVSDFTPESIGLLLSLIENMNIIVPVSYAVKTPEEYFKIAQVTKIIYVNEQISIMNRVMVEKEHKLIVQLRERQHPGLIVFSSGSTGKIKAAIHDFVPLLEKFKIKRKTFRSLTFLLFDHLGGISTLFFILANAGLVVAPKDRTPANICRLIEKYKIELLPTTPSFLNMILFSGEYKNYNLKSLKMITYGTEVMQKQTLERFRQLYPKIKFKQTYGLSELGVIRTRSKDSDSLWLKIGGDDYQTKILDDILYIKTETAMLGYLNAPSLFDEDGWFNTQDKVIVKGEWMRILGRETDLINVGGQKVFPAEVESVLLELNNIAEAAVFGKKNVLMGEVVAARLNLFEEEDIRELKKRIQLHCKDRIESFKVPVHIEVTEDLQISERFKKIR